jgi:hypothetical protein
MARSKDSRPVLFIAVAALVVATMVIAIVLARREIAPDPISEIYCQFWAEETNVLSGEPIWIIYEIRNRSDRAATFESGLIPMRDYTLPVGDRGGRLGGRFFEIMCFDEPVAYLGRRDGREVVEPVHLAPGQTVRFRLDLEPNYEMHEEGIYEIRALGPATFLDNDGEEIPVAFQTAPVTVIVEAQP